MRATARKAMERRSRKLIKPGLQLRVSAIFLGIALCCVVAVSTRIVVSMLDVLPTLPSNPERAANLLIGIALRDSLLVAAWMLPLMFGVGIIVTFHIAGPVYRMERYCEDIASGASPPPCRLRDGDEFVELCQRINDVVDTLRATRSGTENTATDEPEFYAQGSAACDGDTPTSDPVMAAGPPADD